MGCHVFPQGIFPNQISLWHTDSQIWSPIGPNSTPYSFYHLLNQALVPEMVSHFPQAHAKSPSFVQSAVVKVAELPGGKQITLLMMREGLQRGAIGGLA